MGQEFIQAAVSALDGNKSMEEALSDAASLMPEGTESGVDEAGRLYCEIPMNAGQALRIELDSFFKGPPPKKDYKQQRKNGQETGRTARS